MNKHFFSLYIGACAKKGDALTNIDEHILMKHIEDKKVGEAQGSGVHSHRHAFYVLFGIVSLDLIWKSAMQPP